MPVPIPTKIEDRFNEFIPQQIGQRLERSFLSDDVLNWIQKNLTPDQVFEKSVLESWAEENGYSKEE